MIRQTTSNLILRMTSFSAIHQIHPLLYGSREDRSLSLQQARSILVVRTDEIGDLVLCSPFLRALRQAAPKARITLLVKSGVSAIFERSPHIDEILCYPLAMGGGNKIKFKRLYRSWIFAIRHLWKRQIDLAILPRWDLDLMQGVPLTYLSRARRRIGYSEHVNPDKALLNPGHDALFTDVLTQSEPRHEVQRNLDILRYLGVNPESDQLELSIGEDDRAAAETFFRSCPAKRYIGLFPGAGARNRCWPVERYEEVVGMLLLDPNTVVLVGGGRDVVPLGNQLVSVKGDRVINVAGTFSLRQTAAVLSRCDFYLGADSGPMHIAAAMGTPVICISNFPKDGNPNHANSLIRFHPWGVPFEIAQPDHCLPPCTEGCHILDAHCLLQVTTTDVLAAIERLEKRIQVS